MSEEKWKLEKDLCRCCLNEGTFKNLAEPFLYQGEEEIYSEMLLESLDVNIIPVSGPLCTSTYTICEECILRVRDACHFKRLVLSNEKRFHDLYSRNIIQLTSSDLGVKKEAPDSDNEPIEDEVKMEALDDDDNFRLNYDDEVNDDGDNKSDINLDLQAAKKAKAKKPKAKEKAKPRKRAARPAPRKTKAEAGAEEPKEKKDGSDAVPDPGYIVAGKEAQYVCKICETIFKSLNGLKCHITQNHIRSESDRVAKFRCRKCLIEFTNKDDIISHGLDIHGDVYDDPNQICSVKVFICDYCGIEIYDRKRDMIRHLKAHGFYNGLSCPKVSKKLPNANCRSKRLHTCGMCSYTTPKKSNLVSHQRRMHKKEKNIPCTLCDAKFFSATDLRTHMVRHNPVKKFKCSYCEKMFPRLETKRRHEMIHTGEKRKVCLICNARFVQKSSLTYHMKKCHPETV